jgi:hypothetical protein
MNRPTFYINNKPIRAGGVIFYYQDELTKNIKILMQYTERTTDNIKRFLYEDIGGKTDNLDTCINDTIIREVIEETNNVISKEILEKYFNKDHKHIYLKKSKYYLVLVKVDTDIKNIDRRSFGKEDSSNGKKRQFFWMDSTRLSKGTPFNERIWLIRKDINDFFSTLM